MNGRWITADFSAFYRSNQFADVLIEIVEDPHSVEPGYGTMSSLGEASPGSSGCASKVLDTFPGHRMILWQGCEFLQAKLHNWCTSDKDAIAKPGLGNNSDVHPEQYSERRTAAAQQTITLSVPKGQVQTGQLLVRCFYEAGSSSFRLDQVPQQQVLELLVLADRYNAVSVAMAAAAALGSLKPEDMQWSLVVRLHELQLEMNTLKVLPGYSAAVATANHKLHNSLGDLEFVWRYEETAQLMQQIPFCLLYQLLADKRTKAASEDTVVYTIDRWLNHQQQAAAAVPADVTSVDAVVASKDAVLQQQIEELVKLIRLPSCSQLFLTTVVPNAKWLMQHTTAAELATAASLAQQPATCVQDALRMCSSIMLQREAWNLPRRPPSTVDSLILELEVPLKQLKRMVDTRLRQLQAAKPQEGAPGVELYPTAAAVPIAEQSDWRIGAAATAALVAVGAAYSGIDSKSGVWQGRSFYLKLQLSASRRLTVSLCLRPMLAESEVYSSAAKDTNSKHGGQETRELVVVHCSLCAVRFGTVEVCRKADRQRTIAAGDIGYTWTDFFGLGDIHSWQRVKVGLISKCQLAVGDGSIVVRARISSIY